MGQTPRCPGNPGHRCSRRTPRAWFEPRGLTHHSPLGLSLTNVKKAVLARRDMLADLSILLRTTRDSATSTRNCGIFGGEEVDLELVMSLTPFKIETWTVLIEMIKDHLREGRPGTFEYGDLSEIIHKSTELQAFARRYLLSHDGVQPHSSD
jgi:hypothetical protein